MIKLYRASYCYSKRFIPWIAHSLKHLFTKIISLCRIFLPYFQLNDQIRLFVFELPTFSFYQLLCVKSIYGTIDLLDFTQKSLKSSTWLKDQLQKFIISNYFVNQAHTQKFNFAHSSPHKIFWLRILGMHWFSCDWSCNTTPIFWMGNRSTSCVNPIKTLNMISFTRSLWTDFWFYHGKSILTPEPTYTIIQMCGLWNIGSIYFLFVGVDKFCAIKTTTTIMKSWIKTIFIIPFD